MRLSRLVRDFADAASATHSASELTDLIEHAARDLGFEFVALLHSPSLFRRSPRLIRYDNYPPGWDRRLVRHGQKIIDPVLLVARRRLRAVLWPDALPDVPLSTIQQAILTEAYRLGIRQGITIPANIPGEPEGSISFATGRTRQIGQERLLIADSIGRIAFDAARRTAAFSDFPAFLPHVSERERECIYWIAHGKTDQDVADILGIGLETVRTYVKSAFRQLGVITRAQLVHEALRLGLIDFVPSIPPYG